MFSSPFLPPMPTAIIPTSRKIQAAEKYSVWTCANWEDEWDEQPFLLVNWCQWSAGPTVNSAELEWSYGIGMRQGEGSISTVDPAELLDLYVKIEIQQFNADGSDGDPLLWYGIIVEPHDNPIGPKIDGDGNRTPRGCQKFLAYGLEHLLDLEPIQSAYVESSVGNVYRLGRGLTFNDDYHFRPSTGIDKKQHTDLPGNRSQQERDGSYVFAFDCTQAEVWTPLTVVEYLLNYHTPQNSNGDIAVPFDLDDLCYLYLPDFGRPKIDFSGKTVKNLLDELIDRRRLLGYTVEVSGDESAILVRVFTFTDKDIQAPDGSGTIAANPDQKSLDFDTAPDIAGVFLKESATTLYDQVIAIGARIVCCGTISGQDETLVAHWTDAQQTEYCAGASGQSAYASMDDSQKEDANDLARKADHLKRVYSWFGLDLASDGWDGTVLNGEDGAEANNLFPYDALGLDQNADAAWYLPACRFASSLPLKTDHDYSGSNIANQNIPDTSPPGQLWTYRPIYVLVKIQDIDGNDLGYVEGDKSHIETELLGNGAGNPVSISAQPQPDAPGVILRASGSAGQHSIAGTDFTSTTGTTEMPPDLDWNDNLIVTFAMESGQTMLAKYPDPVNSDWDFSRVLRIDVSARCGLHYVAPGTVVRCVAGKLQRTTEGGFIRDDRNLLQQIAAVAWQWYGQPRQSFSFSFRQASGLLSIGDLITQIGSGGTQQTVRSVVTSVKIDFARADGDTHRTTVETQWGELDPLKLLST